MQWATIATLIVQYGLPFVEGLIQRWTNNSPVTIDDWNVLKALAQNTALSQMKAALARAGIPETDPKAAALLAQVEGVPGPAAATGSTVTVTVTPPQPS